MLTPIYIEGSETNPTVILDKGKNKFELSGRSFPADISLFYNPILEWVTEYVKIPNTETLFSFRLDYFNSSTARMIVKLLVILEEIQKTGNKIKVIWYFNKNDEIMLERGEEINEVVKLPFELKEFAQ